MIASVILLLPDIAARNNGNPTTKRPAYEARIIPIIALLKQLDYSLRKRHEIIIYLISQYRSVNIVGGRFLFTSLLTDS